MFARGKPSWRFEQATDFLLHQALYIRDRLKLDVAIAGSVPPKLLNRPHGEPTVLNQREHTEASLDWPIWWEALVRTRSADQFAGTAATPQRLAAPVDDLESSLDADSYALVKAVNILKRESIDWVNRAPRSRSAKRDQVSREFIEAIVAESRMSGVDNSYLFNVFALNLAVEGTWWVLFEPGVVLCSPLAASDRHIAMTMLRKAVN